MKPATEKYTPKKNWRLEDIDFGAIDSTLVRDDEQLFFLLTSASFVEIMADLYARNLVDHYQDNPDASAWLTDHWRQEEIQHGKSLRAYIRAAWPEFDWDSAYHGFAQQYGALCTAEELEPSRALEMAARCVVETGTSTLYRCLYDYANEPVLKQLLTQIKADEVRHFTHFHRLFQAYNAIEKNSAATVARTIWRRIREIGDDDGYVAFKHAFIGRHPDTPFNDADYVRFSKKINRWARRRYPYRMAVDMLLAPLPLAPFLKRLLRLPLTAVARATIF